MNFVLFYLNQSIFFQRQLADKNRSLPETAILHRCSHISEVNLSILLCELPCIHIQIYLCGEWPVPQQWTVNRETVCRIEKPGYYKKSV